MSSRYLLSVPSQKLKQDAALPTRAKSVFIRKHGWYTRLVLEHEDLGRGLGRPEFLVRDFEYRCSDLICIQSIQPYFRGFIIYEKQAFHSCALPNLDLKTFIQYNEYSPRFASATCTEQISIQSAGQVKTAEILSNLMMGYALADTLALHKEDIPRNLVVQPNELLKSKWPASMLPLSQPCFL